MAYDPHVRPAERLPRIPQEQWTDEQRKVAADIAAGPRGELRGPFIALLRSPGVAGPMQELGEYLRYRSPLDRRLAEMATLMAARHSKKILKARRLHSKCGDQFTSRSTR